MYCWRFCLFICLSMVLVCVLLTYLFDCFLMQCLFVCSWFVCCYVLLICIFSFFPFLSPFSLLFSFYVFSFFAFYLYCSFSSFHYSHFLCFSSSSFILHLLAASYLFQPTFTPASPPLPAPSASAPAATVCAHHPLQVHDGDAVLPYHGRAVRIRDPAAPWPGRLRDQGKAATPLVAVVKWSETSGYDSEKLLLLKEVFGLVFLDTLAFKYEYFLSPCTWINKFL